MDLRDPRGDVVVKTCLTIHGGLMVRLDGIHSTMIPVTKIGKL